MLSGIVKTKYGLVGGIALAGCILYRGIPYAKPPLGEDRFKAPRAPEAWDGLFAADHFPSRAPQSGSEDMPLYGKEFYSQPEYQTPMSEDCLYLNIWRPAEPAAPAASAAGNEATASSGLSDAVEATASSGLSGASASSGPETSVPSDDVRPSSGYPVAIWLHGGAYNHGFGHELEFDGAAYAKRGVILVTINYRLGVLGFLAHPWLSEKENGRSGNYGSLDQIAAIRWVKENIAAFGGDPENITVFGQSAGAMGTQVLISSALTQGLIRRAILQSGGGYDTPMLKPISLAEAEKTGQAFVESLGIRSYEELMTVSPEVLYQAQDKQGLFLTPIVDGYVLEATPDERLEQKKLLPIDYMLGSTKDDLGNMQGMDHTLFYQMTENWCKKREELGEKPSYLYYFSHDLPGDEAGAFHSSELWYTFGTLGRCWRPMEAADYALSGAMLDAWTSFMKTGDPGWPAYTDANPYVKEFK